MTLEWNFLTTTIICTFLKRKHRQTHKSIRTILLFVRHLILLSGCNLVFWLLFYYLFTKKIALRKRNSKKWMNFQIQITKISQMHQINLFPGYLKDRKDSWNKNGNLSVWKKNKNIKSMDNKYHACLNLRRSYQQTISFIIAMINFLVFHNLSKKKILKNNGNPSHILCFSQGSYLLYLREIQYNTQ